MFGKFQKMMRKNVALQETTFKKWNIIKCNHGFGKKSNNEFAEYLLCSLSDPNTTENRTIDVCDVTSSSLTKENLRKKSDVVMEGESNERIEETFDVIVDQEPNSSMVEEHCANEEFLPVLDLSSGTYDSVTPQAKRLCKGLTSDTVDDETEFNISVIRSENDRKQVLLSTPCVIEKTLYKSSIKSRDSRTRNIAISLNKECETRFQRHNTKTSQFESEDDPFGNCNYLSSEESGSSSSEHSYSDGSENEFDSDADSDTYFLPNEIEETLEKLINGVNNVELGPEAETMKELFITEAELRSHDKNFGQCNKTLDMSICSDINKSDAVIEASLASNVDDVKSKLKDVIYECFDEEMMPEEINFVDSEKVIVSLGKLKELRGNICNYRYKSGELCDSNITFHISGRGAMRRLKWTCDKDHDGKWESSEVLKMSHKTPVFVNDILFPGSVLISGNNWKKIELLCNVLNLKIPTSRVYDRVQNQYATPEIKSLWNASKEKVLTVLSSYTEICLCGDGRNDSPGHCARYCSYILMEHFTKVIIDLEVYDKRFSKGISTNMERDALISMLTRLHHFIYIAEITTDASPSVMKAVRELAAKYPTLTHIFHSLDIWHKAKSIRKTLVAVAKTKGNEDLLIWIDAIINHFWHCCQNCNQDESKLKDMWIGVLHHVCGEHVWAESECSHGELVSEEPKEPLKKDSVALEGLRTVIMDPRLLKSLKYYVRFRHTSDLENFNSMILKYASKRIAFDFTYYTARMMLAALDHNVHLTRNNAITQSGSLVYHRKYCKRTGNWHAEPVKEKKEYPHVRYLIAKILQRRVHDTENVNRASLKDQDDPKLVSPTIALKEPPPTAQLVDERMSRKEKN